MEIRVQTLTPLWTGGVDGKCDRIYETGLLGSLRWWMEALVRGMGGCVKESTADQPDQRSSLDPKKFNAQKYRELKDKVERHKYLNDAGLCDISQIWGATGWKRRFRLTISEKKEILNWKNDLKITPPDRTRGWFLKAGWIGQFKMTFSGDSEALTQLYILLRFLEKNGNIGARPQLGYGLFRILETQDLPDINLDSFFNQESHKHHIGEFPDLRTFTFFKLRFTPKKSTWWQTVPGIQQLKRNRESWMQLEQLATNGMVPTTPALKNHLRYHQEWLSPTLPHWLFGTVKHQEKQRSKVSLSWAYRREDKEEWEIRGWLYLPQDKSGQAFRREIVSVFQQQLEKPQNWLKAIGLDPTDYHTAKLTLFPSKNPGQIHDIQTIKTLL